VKRAERKKALLEQSHTMTDKAHPNPDNTSASDQKRSVTGDVHIRGEIFVEPSPTEALARSAAEENKQTHERRKWWLECGTFIVLTIYSALTAIQSCQSIKSAKASQDAVGAAIAANKQSADQFTKQERPYIRLMNPKFAPLVKGNYALGQILLKNFGRTPALHVYTKA
jgi:hypothetical protein